MDKQNYNLLFQSLYPDFFERQDIRGLPERSTYDEMVLLLREFDLQRYQKRFDENVSFGFYDGALEPLKKKVERVDTGWGVWYNGEGRIYCGFVDGEAVSFCLVDDMGVHHIGGQALKIGGPGCVGTLPEYRNKGIGLTMVGKVTQLLKEEGFDYSYIHYTGVAPWYGKLGYRTVVRWDKHGILR